MKAGSRFNAAGSFPAVYGSTTPELAMIESLAYQRRANLPVERAMPLVFKAIAVDVERMLDLTNREILKTLKLSADELREDAWWLARARQEESLSQAVGRAAHERGFQSLRAFSAHTLSHGLNVVVLPDHLLAPSYIRVLRRPARK